MIKNKEYVGFLKSIISCVNYGDYYSIKELSNLKLEIWKEKEKQIKKKIKKYSLKCKSRSIEKLEVKDLKFLMEMYSCYIINEVEDDIISFEEFIEML